MRRIFLFLAVALALAAVPGFFPADPADFDGDDTPVALAASMPVPPAGPAAAIGKLHADVPSIFGRESTSIALCRGRPRRSPRMTNRSQAALAMNRLDPDRSARRLGSPSGLPRFSPHPRP